MAPTKTRSSARAVAARAGKRAEEKNETLEWIKSLGVALILFLVIRTFIVTAYSIPSESMEDTLLVGDYLMANNAIFGATLPLTDIRLPAFRDPSRGEIVVFRPTYNDPVIDVVKRVVAVPGDTIAMRDGVTYLNGERLEEPYARYSGLPDEALERQSPGGISWQLPALPAAVDPATYRPTRNSWGPLVVPEEHYFLLGDNRDHSLDSRFMGFIPREVIRGKPLFIYYSFDKYTDASLPFLSEVRWGRIGSAIH